MKAHYSLYDKFPVCQVRQGYLSEKEFAWKEKWGGDHNNDQHGMTTLMVLLWHTHLGSNHQLSNHKTHTTREKL